VPAAYVVFLREGPNGAEVLLHLRQGTGYMDGHWATIAGHVEAGESVLAAAVREASEEVGVEIAEADLVPLTVMQRTQNNDDPIEERVDFIFACRLWIGEPRRAELDKSAALGGFRSQICRRRWCHMSCSCWRGSHLVSPCPWSSRTDSGVSGESAGQMSSPATKAARRVLRREPVR